MAVNLRQTHYRFGIDELAENTHGWLAAEDSPATIAVDTTFLLRFTEQETGGTAANNTDAQFQYSLNGGAWTDITTISAVVKAVASVAFTNGQACTKRLSGTGTFEISGAGCTEDGTSGGPANDIAASGNSETECGLQIVGADVANGDTIQFRLTSPDWTIGYDVTASLTISEAVATGTLSKTLAGLTLASSGTVGSGEIVGTLNQTLAGLSRSIAGTVTVIGSLSKSLASCNLASTAIVQVVGSLSATLATLDKNLVGKVDVIGTVNLSLATAAVSASGTVGEATSIGILQQTLASLALASTGKIDLIGQLALVLDQLSSQILAELTPIPNKSGFLSMIALPLNSLTTTEARMGGSVQMKEALQGHIDILEHR